MNNLSEILKGNTEFENWAIGKSWEEIYSSCPNGEWLLWLFQKSNPADIQLLSLAKGYCAKTMCFFMKNEKDVDAIEAAINFGEGKITLSDLEMFKIDTAERVAYYMAQGEEIQKQYDYDFDSEHYVNTGFYEAVMEYKNKVEVSNGILFLLAGIANNAVEVYAPADNIASITSQCIFNIIDGEGPFKLIDYEVSGNSQAPSKFDSYKVMYSNYVRNTFSAIMSDTAENAMLKNQSIAADICRKRFPFKIWSISNK